MRSHKERKGHCRDRIWFPPDPPRAKSILAAPSAQHRPATGPGPGAGSLPPELSLPLAGPPPSPCFRAALPALSLPALALSSSALGSLTHCFPSSLPSLPLSPQRRLPLPWGGSGHKGACLLLSPGSSPPLSPGGPLQLFQFSSYREVEQQRVWVPGLALPSVCDTGPVALLSGLGFLLWNKGEGPNWMMPLTSLRP